MLMLASAAKIAPLEAAAPGRQQSGGYQRAKSVA
jgi:hypothetical protein